jgi:hypothetical protein
MRLAVIVAVSIAMATGCRADRSGGNADATGTTTVGTTALPPDSTGDIDGDGLADRAWVVDTSANGSYSARLDAELTRFGSRSTGIHRSLTLPEFAGVTDVNGDGRGEVLVEITREDEGVDFIVVELVDERLIQVDHGDAPFFLGVSRIERPDGSIHATGFECKEVASDSPGQEVIHRSSEQQPGESARGREWVFSVRAGLAEQLTATEESFDQSDQDRSAKFSTGICGGREFR